MKLLLGKVINYLNQIWKNDRPIIFILIAGIVIRFSYILVNEFTFDEAAFWYVSKYTSLLDLLRGNYTHVGDMPLVYILTKIWIIFSGQSEFSLRFFVLLFCIGTFLLWIKISQNFSLRKFETYSLLAMLWFMPIATHVVARSNLITLFFQTLFIYSYLQYIEKESKQDFLIALISLSISLFSGFSSFYLIIATIVHTIIQKKTIKKILFIAIIPIIGAAGWMAYYLQQPSTNIALVNYEKFENRNIVRSFGYIIQDILGYISVWNWRSDIVPSPQEYKINEFIRNGSFIFYCFVLIFFFVSVIKVGLKNKIMSFGLTFWLIPWITAGLFSWFYFNVISIRLLWWTILPLMMITSQLLSQFFYKKNVYQLGSICLLAAIIIGMCVSNFINYSKRNYQFSKIYKKILEYKDEENLCLIGSSFIAEDLLKYYDSSKLHKKNLHITSVDYHIEHTYESLKYINPSICSTLFVLHWYDLDENQNPFADRIHNVTKKYTRHDQVVLSDLAHYASLDIYK